MELRFEIEFDGRIWNTAYSDNILCIETKNLITKSTVFHLLDLQTVDIISSFHSPLDAFFSSLDTFSNGITIVHGFDNNESILTKGISVHNSTGETLFFSTDYLFEALTTKGILLTNKEQQLFLLENNIPVALSEEVSLMPSVSSGVFLPIHYPGDSEHFETIASFLKQEWNLNPVKGMDYLEFEDKIMISFYLSDSQGLRNLLFVLNSKGEKEFEEVLAENLKGIGVETFFVLNQNLYFIKKGVNFAGVSL